ncbi:MAG: chaperone NapD [Magnetospirillum sp.]|nr:chaperone NapD [Magnetospirillum sp.]
MRLSNFVEKEQTRPHELVENICGVLVYVRPELRDTVRDTLAAMPGVEVHQVTDQGKMVVTVEDADGHWAGATITSFNDVEGVMSFALVYHHFDSDLEGETVS